MKRKNAFTLIELLAVIIVLSIIAVITVPVILSIIENAQRKIAIDSAYGYKKSIDKWNLERMQDDPSASLDGIYKINNGKLNNEEIPITGDKSIHGTLVFEDDELTSGCIVIGKYKIEYLNENFEITGKEECH